MRARLCGRLQLLLSRTQTATRKGLPILYFCYYEAAPCDFEEVERAVSSMQLVLLDRKVNEKDERSIVSSGSFTCMSSSRTFVELFPLGMCSSLEEVPCHFYVFRIYTLTSMKYRRSKHPPNFIKLQ